MTPEQLPSSDKSHTSHTPGRHITDLLPAYINGTLEQEARLQVQRHLADCAACREELALWTTLANVSRETLAPTRIAAPTPALMADVWQRIDRPLLAHFGLSIVFTALLTRIPGALQRLRRQARIAGQITLSQLRLIPIGIWAASTLAVIFTFVGLILFGIHTRIDARHIAAMQSLIAPLVTGICLAFIYSPEHDSGLEIALATPTSPRTILLARLGLVFGYNFLLTFAVTLIMALSGGENFVALVSLWMGPMLFLSALSLAVSIGIGTVAGVTVAGAFWFGHVISLPQMLIVPLADSARSPLIFLWQTTPLVLVLAAVFLLLALLAAPRRIPRWI